MENNPQRKTSTLSAAIKYARGSRKASKLDISRLTVEDLLIEYKKKAQESWDVAWDLLMSNDWKNVAGEGLDSGIVSCISRDKLGKIFMLEGYVDVTPNDAFKEAVLNIESSPEWNPTVIECRTLQVIDENTDISYNVTAEAGGGLISSRDFVSVRHWATKDGIILSAGCAVLHPNMPPSKKYIRGENKSGGWVFKPVADNPNRCVFCWIVNSDLKGWIPKAAVDKAISGTLLEFLQHLRSRLQHH